MNYMRNGCNHYKNNNIIVMKLCVINESILRFNCLVKKILNNAGNFLVVFIPNLTLMRLTR